MPPLGEPRRLHRASGTPSSHFLLHCPAFQEPPIDACFPFYPPRVSHLLHAQQISLFFPSLFSFCPFMCPSDPALFWPRDLLVFCRDHHPRVFRIRSKQSSPTLWLSPFFGDPVPPYLLRALNSDICLFTFLLGVFPILPSPLIDLSRENKDCFFFLLLPRLDPLFASLPRIPHS